MIRRLMKTFFYNLGYKVSRSNNPLRTFGESLRQLKMKGFKPGTVFDVGVADGTHDLYKVFPHAYMVLIEPLLEYQPDLENICSQYTGEYYIAAAGAEAGKGSLHIGNDARKSSLVRMDVRGGVASTRTVPLVSLDGLIASRDYGEPYLIKIDVEGAELVALQGAVGVLEHTEVVILEVAVLDRGGETPEFCEVISRMKDYGFVAYDIVGAADGSPGALAHVDIVFVQEDGRFR